MSLFSLSWDEYVSVVSREPISRLSEDRDQKMVESESRKSGSSQASRQENMVLDSVLTESCRA